MRIVTVFKYVLLSFVCIVAISCSDSKEPAMHSQVAVIDTVTVLCDPSWENSIRTFITTYEGLNPHRKVLLIVKPESDCVADLLHGTYRTVFVSRDLNPKEKEYVTKKQWSIKNDSLCYDGLTWIAPKTFSRDSLTVAEIKALFQSGLLDGASYTIQLNGEGCSVANYLTAYFGVPPATKHIFTGGDDIAIIKSVQTHSNALACISSSWLVNLEDKIHRDYLSSIKVIKISATAQGPAYSSFQNDLALGTYPFKRVLRVLNSDANTGLGTAFASFFIHNRGQRLFLKEGLLPYQVPAREIELKNK
jgi:phosphate transport system substrate-binding protein